MVADRAAHHHHVAGADLIEAEPQARAPDTEAGGRKVEAAALAAAQNLGVAGRDPHAAFLCGACHASNQAIELGKFHSLLDERIQAQIDRRSARDREIIHRSMHGERADISARKFERVHGKAVRGDQHLSRRHRQIGRIGADVELRIGQMARKNVRDERPHEAAAIAIGEGDKFIFDHARLPR